MDNWKADRISSAEAGENPTVLAKLQSGYAVIGDTQFMPGYCVLLAHPKVRSLNALPPKRRMEFLSDMTRLGDAIQEVYQPARLNYEILGNSDEYLHAHVFPRYDWEPETRKKKPVWFYPEENWTSEDCRYDQEKYGEDIAKLKKELEAGV